MGRNYSRKLNPSLADLSLLWDSANSDWALSALSNIKDLIVSDLNFLKVPKTVYREPLTGFTETLEGSDSTYLILAPAGTLAAGTVVLPSSIEVVDKQTVLVSTSQEITALTVDGNGAALVGPPTTLLLGEFFTMKYDAEHVTWNRVG